MTMEEALRAVLEEAPSDKGFNAYAQAYAKRAILDGMKGETLRVQILYILNNLGSWRGPRAKEVKQFLKSFKP